MNHPITFNQILQTSNHTAFILGTEEKKFAIYTEPFVGEHLQKELSEQGPARPLTHNLLYTILTELEVEILQLLINDVKGTIYCAKLLLKQTLGDKTKLIEIDVRPSDGISLALLHEIPIYCSKEVLEKAPSTQ